MKKIYLMVSYTGTVLSNLIRLYTNKEYTHVSISLDVELNQLYSFGRLNPYNAFIGGFVREGKDIGTFKRFKNTKVAIYSLEVADENYERAKYIIDTIKTNKEEYKFNLLGLFLVAFHKRIYRRKAFYCAEFVKYILEKSKSVDKKLPDIIKPADFEKIHGIRLEYKGLLRHYHYEKTYSFKELYSKRKIFSLK